MAIQRHMFYIQPINDIYMEIAAMYFLWLIGMLILRGRARRITGIVFALLSAVLIFLLTVYGRDSSGTKEINLIPFITFTYATVENEMYRMLFMNVALFIPLGLSLPFALPDKYRHKYLITVISGAFLSVTIEVFQFLFSIGRTETDDVLMNTLGVIIGGSAYLLHCGIMKLFRLIKSKIQRRNT